MSLTIQALAAAGSLITAVGILFLWRQTSLMRAQIRDDHDRSRREKLVTVMREWNQDISQSTAAAQKLAAALGREQCTAIFRMEPIEIDESLLPLATSALAELGTDLQSQDGWVKLGVREVTHLRYLVISYLNTLETCLAAWHLGIVEMEHMEEEFSFLTDRSMTDPALVAFREVLGANDGYPALRAFLKKVAEKNTERHAEPIAIK